MKRSLLLGLTFLFINLIHENCFAGTEKPDPKGVPVTIHSVIPVNARISDPVTTIRTEGNNCNCWLDRDGSWMIVPFDGSGASGGPGIPPDYRNDDWSTTPITTPFNFCFYGISYNSVIINNNGNISFLNPNSTYTADSFPSVNFNMISPFWSDCDTRGPMSGLVYYKLTATSLIVQWDHVGYFSFHDSLVNTFQLIITDGTDPVLDAGNNVSFCYQDMQWTTGDASSGINGFGGFPATAGANPGDGINSVQIGRYDQPGLAYDGPYGAYDGVDMLDYLSLSFSVCTAVNIAPFVKHAGLCDTLELCVGDTSIIDYEFFSPEQGQATTAAFNFNGITGCSTLQSTTGNIATISAEIIGLPSNMGYHTLNVTATDNGSPQQSLTTDVVIHVNEIIPSYTYFPDPATLGDTITFTGVAADGVIHTWDFGDGSPVDTGETVTHVFQSPLMFDVIHHAYNSYCDFTASESQTLSVITSIQDASTSPSISLTPNPASICVKLLSSDKTKKYHLIITDIKGSVVVDYSAAQSNDMISVKALESGVYFYQIIWPEGKYTGKFVKQ